MYVDPSHRYAVGEVSGWSHTEVRGMLEFAPQRSSKHRIDIRVLEYPPSRDDVMQATESVLRALPQSRGLAHSDQDGGALLGVRYSYTFVPRGLQARYQRIDVVLFGRRTFHVIYTAPAGEVIDESALEAVAKTLTEDV